MEIVINISETLKKIADEEDIKTFSHFMWQAILIDAIKNGTPLPKGHGDLIDRSTLEPDTEWSDWDDGWISYSYGQIVDADVVIKADGGGEE